MQHINRSVKLAYNERDLFTSVNRHWGKTVEKLRGNLYIVFISVFGLGATSSCVWSLILALESGSPLADLGGSMGCLRSNPVHTCATQMPYPLYHCPGPFYVIFNIEQSVVIVLGMDLDSYTIKKRPDPMHTFFSLLITMGGECAVGGEESKTWHLLPIPSSPPKILLELRTKNPPSTEIVFQA